MDIHIYKCLATLIKICYFIPDKIFEMGKEKILNVGARTGLLIIYSNNQFWRKRGYHIHSDVVFG